MKTHLKYLQWLLFWFGACLPLTNISAAGGSALAAPSLVHNLPSTEPGFETLRDGEMIDNQIITSLAQDARGLIWIGTQNGLIRYDGYRFRKFSHQAGAPFSLAGDYVYTLYAAPDGRLWVGTFNDGISVFDPDSERFEHFRHDEKVPGSLGGGRISAFSSDGAGGMWIATGQGLNHLASGAKAFTHFRQGSDPGSLLDNNVRSLLRDKAGRLWVGSRGGLQRLAPDGKRFETIVTGRNVQTLFQAQDGKLWLGTKEHGAAWLDASSLPGARPGAQPPSPQVQWLALAQMSHPWITAITQIKTGQIWLASYGGGIMVAAPGDGRVLQTLRHDPALPDSLAFDSVSPQMLMDRAGWLWVGTWGGGLQRTNPNNTLLRNLRHSAKRPNGLSHPNVRSMLELANGQWLIGSKGNGIDVFDRQYGVVKGYRAGSGQPEALPDAYVSALAQTHDGSIWAGTQMAGVVRQLAGTSSWVAVPGLPGKQVHKLFVSRDGSLWAGTVRGVARWQPNQPPNQPPNLQPTPPSGQAAPPARFEVLADERGNAIEVGVRAFAEDGQGRIWIGTNSGLWLYEPGQRGLIRIPAEPKRPDGLISDYILGLLVDRHGQLWLATDKGLERLKSRDAKLARFEHISALVDLRGTDLVGNLLEDRQGRIWAGATVIEADPGRSGRLRMNRLSLTDGQEINLAWQGSFAQTRDGLLLFGSSRGLAVIDPAHFKAYDYAPPMVVTEIKINGQAVAPGLLVAPPSRSQPENKAGFGGPVNLTLSSAQRDFSIEFAALDYSEPKKNRYQYRLLGYDKDWINTDANHRSANYGNLWPGSWTLQVRGSNRAGDWSRHELAITIRVLPAWWQTWWFGLVLLLGVSAFMALLVRTRTRYLRQRQRELEQLVSERTGELRQKQGELVHANHELERSNDALNQAIEALNEANAGLVISVETLRQLGEIGREITANLDADIVFDSLHRYVSGLLNAPTMTIYRMNQAATMLEAVFGRQDDKAMPMRNVEMASPVSNVARAAREGQELLVNYDPQDNSTNIPGARRMHTGLFAPLVVGDRVMGVMSIQSDRENAYGQRERLIFRTLTAFGAIALSNSGAHAELSKSHGELASAHRQLQETQQQLMLQEKMAGLGTLTAGIAHEINNPTNFVHVAAQMQQVEIAEFEQFVASLIEDDEAPAILQAFKQRFTKLSTNVGTMLEGTGRIIAIVKDLRSFSRLAESERKTVYISECLLCTLNLVRTAWQEKVDFMIEFTDDPELECWPALLNQVLINLMLNGCQAIASKQDLDGLSSTWRAGPLSGQRGKLWLRLHLNPARDALQIEIEDNGIGIEHAIQTRIMEPFFTTKEVGSGTGTGLSTAFGIVQKHGGRLEFTSSPGEGSCFTVTLPLAGA